MPKAVLIAIYVIGAAFELAGLRTIILEVRKNVAYDRSLSLHTSVRRFRIESANQASRRQKARICALTFVCPSGDPHPTDAGYRAMAAAVWAASGYTGNS